MLLREAFIKDQLLPYIGNKRKLLPLIQTAIRSTGPPSGVFLDLFSGSGVVSRLAKVMGYRVIANDWEPYTVCINNAYIRNNKAPPFVKLGGLEKAINSLNKLEPIRGYIATHYCPCDDESPDLDRERLFYTQENGRRIDAIREQITQWKAEDVIDENEEAVILAPLVFQSAYCSNTSGVFKGFHRGWGGATKTAWYRIRSKLALRAPKFYDNGERNECLRANANEIAGEIECDLAYIDPPYNQHQYGSNYHMLNTVALWDKPPLEPFFDNRNGRNNKAGIRKDWRVERRSHYCYADTASAAMSELISKLRSHYILVSYSTDGIIPIQDMIGALSERGSLSVFTRNYKRYRVSRQRPSTRSHTVEFVLVANTLEAGGTSNRRAVEEEILRQSEETCELPVLAQAD
ncbi:MAG: DNA adenine methylase [Armatimonadota bacterium]|nr:DNA adenine methylase [Armatimonadota bacterium]